jgi:hypothetical protein
MLFRAKIFFIAPVFATLCVVLCIINVAVPSVAMETKHEEEIEGILVPHQFVSCLKECCELAYEPVTKIEEQKNFSLFFSDISCSDESFCGFVRKIGNSLVVAFPGTRGGHPFLSDLWKDISAFTSDTSYCESLKKDNIAVHSGFAADVMNFYDAMFNTIEKEHFDDIFFTGHRDRKSVV